MVESWALGRILMFMQPWGPPTQKMRIMPVQNINNPFCVDTQSPDDIAYFAQAILITPYIETQTPHNIGTWTLRVAPACRLGLLRKPWAHRIGRLDMYSP